MPASEKRCTVDMRHAVRSTRLIKAFQTDELFVISSSIVEKCCKCLGNEKHKASHSLYCGPSEFVTDDTKHRGMWFTSLQFIGHAMFMTTQPSKTPPLRIYLTDWQRRLSFMLLPERQWEHLNWNRRRDRMDQKEGHGLLCSSYIIKTTKWKTKLVGHVEWMGQIKEAGTAQSV